jgi:ABC-type transport system substrate-binding protein
MSSIIKHVLRFVLVGGVLLALFVSFSLPGPEAATAKPWEKWDYSKEKPVQGGYFRSASAVDVGLMNPNHWPVNDWGVIVLFFEKLVTTKGDFLEVPWLIESFEFVDPLTCVFKLRKGITYTDGTIFNAEAVKYQMDWIQDKSNGCWSRAWLSPLKSTDVVDEHTVKFHFTKPWGSFLGIMASVPGFAMSPNALKADIMIKESKKIKRKAKQAKKKAAKAEKKAKAAETKGDAEYKKAVAKAEKARKRATKLEKQASALVEKVKNLKESDGNPVGTAKYILEDRSSGNWIKVRRNPNWWYAKTVGHPDMPYFDGRIVTVIPDPSVQLANFKAGKVDVIYPAKSHYASLSKDSRFRVYVGTLNWNVGLRFNHARPPFNDIRMRKAVSHALDRKALIAGLEFGMARIASSFFPGDHWAHNPHLKPVKYDPELTRKLMADAGHAKGITIKGHMGNDSNSVSLTEAVKSMHIEYDLATNVYVYMFEPDLCVTNFYHPDGGWNHGRSNNRKVIKLIDEGRREVDFAKRQKIYWQIEEALNENYEDVYLWWPMVISAYSKQVSGFVFEGGLKEHKEVWDRSHPLWFKDGKEPQR